MQFFLCSGVLSKDRVPEIELLCQRSGLFYFQDLGKLYDT